MPPQSMAVNSGPGEGPLTEPEPVPSVVTVSFCWGMGSNLALSLMASLIVTSQGEVVPMQVPGLPSIAVQPVKVVRSEWLAKRVIVAPWL